MGIFLIPTLYAGDYLSLGSDAPDFTLEDQEGFYHSLSYHRGKYVLLFFYPRDFTVNAVQKMKKMKGVYSKLFDRDVVVYGISNDYVATHRKFHDKFHLGFDLLADPNEECIKAYGVDGWLGTKPYAFLVGPDGRIFRIYENMRLLFESTEIIEGSFFRK